MAGERGSGAGKSRDMQAVVTIAKGHLGQMSDFVAHGIERLSQAEVHLLRLESFPEDKEALQAVLRVLQTLQRGAGLLGLEELSSYAAEQERILRGVSLGKIELTGEAIDRLFDAADVLKRHLGYMGEAAASGSALPGPQTLPELRAQVESLSAHGARAAAGSPRRCEFRGEETPRGDPCGIGRDAGTGARSRSGRAEIRPPRRSA